MKKISSLDGITNAYSRRILGNILNQDPLKVLKESPKRLKRAMAGLTPAQLRKQPNEGGWSITQIVTHLSDAELVVGYRVRMTLAHSGCDIQAYDEAAWAREMKYEKRDARKSLAFYTSLRENLVTLLKSLSDEELQRYGMHSERGKETVERLSQMIAGHDVNHVRRVEEIRKLLKKKKR